MFKMKFFSVVFFTALISLTICAESKISYNLSTEPKSIDPHLTHANPGIETAVVCMEGLVRWGKQSGEIIPGVAETWDVSEDGITWTFNLRKNATWSNAEPVTAHDFHFGMKRALEPATGAQTVSFLYYIKNAQKYNEEKIKDFSEVGIKVIDDYTLEIKLEKPCAFFDEIIGLPISFPLNQEFFNKVGGEDEYALEADTMLYNGPYKITDWVHDGKIVLKKNPYYWNKENIKTDTLEFGMVNDNNTALNMYETDTFDIIRIGGEQLRRYKDSKELVQVQTGVLYIQFNVENKFFKNKKIRQAIGLAIDRNILCDKIRGDGSEPAYAYVPYGVPGIDGKSFREAYGENLFSEDVTKAKKLLKEGLEEIGHTGPVEFSLLTGEDGAYTKAAQYIQEQLRVNLGINVDIEKTTFSIRLSKLHQGDFDAAWAVWFPDYNDPSTYINKWRSNSNNNTANWSNKEYDKFAEKAESTTDMNERMNAMAGAEKILIEEMPIAPLFYYTRNWLVKPNVKDVVIRSLCPEISFYWAYTENNE